MSCYILQVAYSSHSSIVGALVHGLITATVSGAATRPALACDAVEPFSNTRTGSSPALRPVLRSPIDYGDERRFDVANVEWWDVVVDLTTAKIERRNR